MELNISQYKKKYGTDVCYGHTSNGKPQGYISELHSMFIIANVWVKVDS